MSSNKKRYLIKVIILGDSGVGKTNLLNRYVKDQFSRHHKATIGADFLTKDHTIDNTVVQLQLWDTAGQEVHNSMAASFYRGSECCVLVFDLTDINTFEKVEIWRQEFLKQTGPKDAENFPFVILGNKCDKVNERKVTEAKIKQYIEAHGNYPFFETSAQDNLNVNKAFEEVARLAFKRNSKEDDIYRPPKQIDLKKPKETVDNKKCCQ